MKIHLITVGTPKLHYAKLGWEEYYKRLQRQHTVRVTHLADKSNTAEHLLAAAAGTSLVVMEIEGAQLSSRQLADFLRKKELDAREVSFMIGGPEGLPAEVIAQANHQLSLSKLTFPHDLAMVVLLEALYRASSINAGMPYHK
ncbi:MAG: Ribosomal large subunit methyltransferase [Candidatus Saccharibacteria bacterium]|nr:Ribosomal large subunit methyltransferase [Candidatus Saccharibacteria bacterium]